MKAMRRTKKRYRIDTTGLIVSGPEDKPQLAGYIFDFQGRSFDPSSGIKIGERSPTQAEIDVHNAALSRMELDAMHERGRAVLYLHGVDSRRNYAVTQYVGTWAALPAEYIRCHRHSRSRHNIGRTRLDVWFKFRGHEYHGVNIGDNDIVRVKRIKERN